MFTPRKFALSSAEQADAGAPILLCGPIQRNLKLAAGLGYQAIELHTREDVLLDYDAVVAQCHETGIGISAVVTGRLNTQGKVSLMDDRPYVTQAGMDCMLRYIQMAERLKTDIVVGWVKGRVPDGSERKRYLDRLAANLAILCQTAQQSGVRVMAEVINRYETNVFTTASETMGFINEYQIPNLYVHLDTFHMNIEEADPVAAIKLCGDKLKYFHLADNTRNYPGSGCLDFGVYLNALEQIGYDGYLSVECFPVPDGNTAAAKAIAYLGSL